VVLTSAPDYFANQYSTDEIPTQPVPVDINQYHKLNMYFKSTVQLYKNMV